MRSFAHLCKPIRYSLFLSKKLSSLASVYQSIYGISCQGRACGVGRVPGLVSLVNLEISAEKALLNVSDNWLTDQVILEILRKAPLQWHGRPVPGRLLKIAMGRGFFLIFFFF